MEFNAETLKAVAQIVNGIIILVGVFVYVKKGQYDDALGIVQGVFSNAVSATQHTGTNKLDLKPVAITLVKKGLGDTTVTKAVKKLGIELDDQAIGDLIERVLSSGKLGISNPIKDVLKARGKGAVLGFLNFKLNKVKV